jgi:fructokinase
VIVVAGEALIDLLVQPDGRVTAVPGGGPFNTARTIGRLGGEVAFLGRLSTDRFGRGMRETLAADGVDLRFVESTDHPTTLAIAELDEDGSAKYRFLTEGTSAPGLSAAAAAAAFGSMPVAVHVGTLGLVLEPMADVLAGALDAGGTYLAMVDLNIRRTAIRDAGAFGRRMDSVLAAADVIKASVEDLDYAFPQIEPTAAAASLSARDGATVLVTDGARAVRIVTPQCVREVGVPHTDVVDSVGAGDAFGGAFLAWWIEHGHGRHELGDPDALVEAVGRAIDVATLTVERAGADPPRRSDVGWPPL